MFRWIILAGIIVCSDQITKWLLLTSVDLTQSIPLIPGLNLQLAFNQGAAFGFLAEHSGWQRLFFIGITILVVTSIIIWLIKLSKKEVLDGIALSVILGGALGNLVDRIRFGYVVDFIDVYYRHWHWYTFNIADIAICCGTAILLYTLIVKR